MWEIAGPAAYLAHRLVAVHLRHHDVDQRHVDIGYLLEDGDAVPAPLGMQHLDVVGLQHAGQRVDVADVVIDDQHLGARQVGGIETLRRLGRSAFRLLAGQHGRHQQRQLRQVFRTRHVGDRRVERQRMIERLESRREDQQSGSGIAKLFVDAGQRLRIVLCRASQAEHDRVVGGEFVRTGVGRQASDSRHRGDAVADRVDQRQAPVRIGVDDQDIALRAQPVAVDGLEYPGELVRRDRFGRHAGGALAHQRIEIVGARDDVDRHALGLGIVAQKVEQHPAVDVGEPEIEGDGVRHQLSRQCQRTRTGRRQHALQAGGTGKTEQKPAEGGVVLDDQHDAIARHDAVAIVGEFRQRLADQSGRRQRRQLDALLGRRADCRARPVERNDQRERRALARHAFDPELAAEQAGDLAADRQSEPGAAIFAAGGSVGLLEGFEDQLLLVLGNADAGIGDGDRQRSRGHDRAVARRTGTGGAETQRDLALQR